MTRFEEYIERKRAQYGDKFDETDLLPQFRPFFDSGERIRVSTQYEEPYVRTGTVGVTTGWRPAFLLMHRSNAHGSSDLLGPRDKIVAVKRGRTYEPIGAAS